MANKTIKIICVLITVSLAIVVILEVYQNTSKNEKIKIGVSAPLTGPTAWWGDYVKQGIDMALEEVPDEEKENIILIWEDDQCSSQKGINAIQKLIFVDKVKYVIGPLCNEVSIPTENLFEDNKVISLTTGLPNKEIAEMGDYHFSFLPEIGFLMKELARYSYYESNNRKIAILSLEDSYGYENYIYFKEYFENYGGEVIAEEFFDKYDTDMKTQLTKIKASGPDSILLVAYGPALINILRQMEELGMDNVEKYGINSFESPSLLVESSDLAEGVVYPRPADKTSRKSVEAFTRNYKNKYGSENGVYSSNAYDSFNLLYWAIKECGYKEDRCIIEKLSSIENYSGANGILNVDSRGVGTYNGVMLKTVKGGTFVQLA